MKYSADQLRTFINSIPTAAWSCSSEGSAESFNRRWLEYTGLSTEDALGWGWKTAIHPEDLPRMVEIFQEGLNSGQPFEVEARLRRFDGAYRRFLLSVSSFRDESERAVKWYGTTTDLEDRTRAENALRESEQSLRLIVDSIPGFIITISAEGEVELINRQFLDYVGKTFDELKGVAGEEFHPDDVPQILEAWKHSFETGQPYEMEHRMRGADGVYRWFHSRCVPQRDAEGRIVHWYNLLTDIEDRKTAEEKLRRLGSELQYERDRLRLLLDLNNRVALHLDLRQLFQAISSELRRVFQCDFVGLVLPENEDKQLRQHMIDFPESKGFFKEGALLPMEGSSAGLAFRSAKPVVLNSVSDVRARCRSADEAQAFYKRVTDEGLQSGCFLPLVSGARVLGVLQLVSRQELRFAEQDVEFLDQVANQIAFTLKNALEYEQVAETKERLHEENLALREEIDQALMFEEIVGSSPALQTVLSNIVMVAPTDSTVLITGETGTGKELIARAIHKRSARSGQAFVTVNCAAIPATLIASELFGHEKGAFTGAMQRRRGRFELAHGGTVFLDEIGELPAETQIALLRVLQEREFERVGGNQAIAVDVRVIAATNRDLSAATAAGTFRTDLFYRLNVFPIPVPSLRERKEDVPILVEYFVKRFAEKMGKQIEKIDKRTLELFEAYHWPGNIRELQNIIERSVILCRGDTFWIDEAWLSMQAQQRSGSSGPLAQTLHDHEKKIIEAALAESKGKVAGSRGAAAKLGIPPSTLDSKIKQFKIEKHKFTTAS